MNMKKGHMLVIGGSKGVGRTIVDVMGKGGYVLSVVSRMEPHEKNENARYWTVDITQQDLLPHVLREIVDQNGRLNHIVFCQQFRGQQDNWIGQIETSLTAVKQIIELTVDNFEKGAGENSIILIGSLAGRLIAREQPVGYHVAKAGLEQMIRYYALALGPRRIRVNGISPNLILKEENKDFFRQNKDLYALYTRISPLGKMIAPDDIAHAVDFLCSARASSITGQNIVIDGGVSLQEHASLARMLASLDNIKITQNR